MFNECGTVSIQRKCEKYWPNDVNQTLEPGHNLVVTLTALLPFVEYEIRMLSVKDVRCTVVDQQYCSQAMLCMGYALQDV